MPTLSGLFKSSEMTLRSNQPVLESEALDLSIKTRFVPNQRFEITIKTPKTPEIDARQLFAELNSLQSGTPFTVVLPLFKKPLGVATGSPVSRYQHDAGATSIAINGLTSNKLGIFKAGDLLKFNGHDKVYQCTSTANTNALGQTTISIFPALRRSVATGELIIFRDVPFTVVAPSRIREYKTSVSNDRFIRFELDCKEKL